MMIKSDPISIFDDKKQDIIFLTLVKHSLIARVSL